MSSEPTRREWQISAGFLVVLLWINLYVCRGLFTIPVPAMNSMHGFWMTIAHWAGNDWFQSNWWPWWDNGIPFEFTYAPLVPALTALFSGVFHATRLLTLQWVTGIAYCLGPMTLYLMAWRMTRAPVYSFLAALFYSLFSPTQLLAMPGPLVWGRFLEARRLFMISIWDDTPHLLAVSMLPLAVLFVARAIEKRSLAWCAAAAVTIAFMTFASTFGPVMALIVAVSLILASKPAMKSRGVAVVVGIGLYAYALCARFLPPSLLHAAGVASKNEGGAWSVHSWPAVGCLAVGIAILWFGGKYIRDPSLRFILLFAWITTAIPVFDVHLGSRFLPQPDRYAAEAELGIALLVAFGIRAALMKAPRAMKGALLVLFLLVCYSQIKTDRRFAKSWIRAGDLTGTIEYRAAVWAEHNLTGMRVFLPGSMNKWGGEFAQLEQYAGGSWSQAYNQAQQMGVEMTDWGAATPEDHRRLSLAWMRAFGVGAMGVNGPKSPEYWPNLHPLQLDGVYPVLWREDDTTIYQVPQRTPGFAHVVTESAILQTMPQSPSDTAGVEKYVAGLDDPALPAATFAWEGTNRIHIHTDVHPDQVLSVQVSWHPGWHAAVSGKAIGVMKDGLGLMWMRPRCNGACDIDLDYDGGWELRICRWLGYFASAGILVFIGRAARARLSRSPPPTPQALQTTR